ncbi:MAG TPA: DUF4290 domain-containing protein [Bacteroidales bacterium]|nr:DUF4290 domain-containing protein [Bacteroidales bacterium]
MEYNTRKERLKLPEYGRNVQNMVNLALAEPNLEKRIELSHAIVGVMGNLNPHLRDIGDFKHKLWDHLAIMSDFKLTEASPYPVPLPEKLYERPAPLPYVSSNIRFKHYGRTVETMLEQALQNENLDERMELIRLCANHMKKSYMTWNKESVTDEIIFDAIRDISRGKISLSNEFQLADVRDHVQKLNKNQKKKRM